MKKWTKVICAVGERVAANKAEQDSTAASATAEAIRNITVLHTATIVLFTIAVSRNDTVARAAAGNYPAIAASREDTVLRAPAIPLLAIVVSCNDTVVCSVPASRDNTAACTIAVVTPQSPQPATILSCTPS